MSRLLVVLAICIMSGGCAIGVTHEYSAFEGTLGVQTDSEVAVTTHDQRPYVVDGGKPGKFVGLSRGGFGNPFDITTVSTNPLADDISASISSALQADGVRVKTVSVLPTDSEADARTTLLSAKTGRSIFLTINEWKSDTFANTKLIYNVLLRIFDGQGTLRADKQIQGEDHLGSGGYNPPEHSRTVIPLAFRSKLKELFNDPKIKAALQ